MAKQTNQKGIQIKCRGMYYFKTDTAKGTKAYEITLMAPSLEFFKETAMKYTGTDENGKKTFSERSFINIRGALKKRLLPILLPKQVPDFARVKYVVIDEIISLSGEPLDLPIELRSRKQLSEYIKNEKIPIEPAEYLDIDELRFDILEYRNDPETFLQNKGQKDTKRAEERAFIEMNNLGETLPPNRKQAGIEDL